MTRKDQRFLSFTALAALVLIALPFTDTDDPAAENSRPLPSETVMYSTPTEPAENEVEHTEPCIRYLIMEQNGAVAVYDTARQEIIEVIEVNMTALPEGDRDILRRGIPVYSDMQLTTLLCGFTE